jgi:DNA-binding NarL/FixJ family response regulator
MIADDHTLMTEGLRRLLEADFDVIGTASNGRELLSMLNSMAPDVIVLDIAMPDLNGIEAARLISKSYPNVKLVFVTQQIDRHYVQAAFRAGASAFVAKQSASTELQGAIHGALRGQTYITSVPGPGQTTLPDVSKIVAGDVTDSSLTPRQRQVLQLTAEGRTVKEIGVSLKISPKTVEFHKAAIMDQLGLRNTADLTRYAVSHGIIRA